LSEHIYDTMIREAGEVVGALAYSFYQRHKREWTVDYTASHGAPPDSAALEEFRSSNMLPSMLAGYLERGRTQAQQFLNTGLEAKVAEIALEVRQSELANSMKNIVVAQLNERRGFWGWLRDAVTSVATNMAALVLVGALVLGIKSLDTVNSMINKLSSADAPARHADVVKPSGPPPAAGPNQQ
jgi:hypothetical protein